LPGRDKITEQENHSTPPHRITHTPPEMLGRENAKKVSPATEDKLLGKLNILPSAHIEKLMSTTTFCNPSFYLIK